MPISIKLWTTGPPKGMFIHTFSSWLMDQLDVMDIDQVLSFDKAEVELKQLRRVLVKYYNERTIEKQFTLKPCRYANKIWRWQ